jgi:hypothetical protein
VLGLGEEGLDGLEDLVHGHRLGEGAVGQRADERAAALEVVADERVDGGGVARLDAVDRQRGARIFLSWMRPAWPR